MTGLPMSFRGHPLIREIAVVLALKVAAIAVIWLAFFGPDTRPTVDGAAIERHLAAPGTSAQ